MIECTVKVYAGEAVRLEVDGGLFRIFYGILWEYSYHHLFSWLSSAGHDKE